MPGTGRWTSDDASLEARLPGPLRQFLELYGASRFWDSHEALEEAWRRSGSDFYQGLILYASAWVHWERRNAHGVRGVAVRQEVAENPDSWPDRVTALPLSLAASRLRGDEVELEE